MLALTRNKAGALLQEYTYGSGDPISLTTPAATYYLTGDALGSVAGVTSATGTPLIRYSYEPFGLKHKITNLAATGRPSSEPLRFAGQYLDTSGRYDMRAREYDPSTGRFQSVDPVATAVSDPYSSVYAYAKNQPTTVTDPSGQCPWCLIGALAGFDLSLGFYTYQCWRDGNCTNSGAINAGVCGAVTGGLSAGTAGGFGGPIFSGLGATGFAGCYGLSALTDPVPAAASAHQAAPQPPPAVRPRK